MHRRHSPAIFALLVVACLALSASASGRESSSRAVAIKLVSLTLAATSRAAPPIASMSPDETATREIVETDRLYNGVRQFGHPRLTHIGSDRTILIHFRSGRVWVSVTTHLPGGVIYVRGNLRRTGLIRSAPVVAGTGRYATVHGHLEIMDLNVRGLAANIYRLTLPAGATRTLA